MDCPKCGVKTKVWRTERHENLVFRVRICPACGVAFRTSEEAFADDTPSAEGKEVANVFAD